MGAQGTRTPASFFSPKQAAGLGAQLSGAWGARHPLPEPSLAQLGSQPREARGGPNLMHSGLLTEVAEGVSGAGAEGELGGEPHPMLAQE